MTIVATFARRQSTHARRSVRIVKQDGLYTVHTPINVKVVAHLLSGELPHALPLGPIARQAFNRLAQLLNRTWGDEETILLVGYEFRDAACPGADTRQA